MDIHTLLNLQKRLIDHAGDLDNVINSSVVQEYARFLAAKYFPKRAGNELYLEPAVHAFACDLVAAPRLHGEAHLWRYNYDDLDILSQFYKYTNKRNGYYHVAIGRTEWPTIERFQQGCKLLEIDFGPNIDDLFNAFRLEGARSRPAARLIETIAGYPSDVALNRAYGFLECESQQRLRRRKGLGRFRFLRRGRQWFALGTKPAPFTTDIRREPLADIFGYRIGLTTDGKAHISVNRRSIDEAKEEILALLETEAKIGFKLRLVSDFYKRFHHQRRFANATDWREMDAWLLRKVRKEMRSHPKSSHSVYLASKHPPQGTTFQPRRSNFFWNVQAELKCDYELIWNPFMWPEPDRAEWLNLQASA